VEKVISGLVEEMDLARVLIQARASEITGLGLRSVAIKTGPIRVNSCTVANSILCDRGEKTQEVETTSIAKEFVIFLTRNSWSARTRAPLFPTAEKIFTPFANAQRSSCLW